MLSDETRFFIDFNLHQVPAALGLDIPTAAAAAMVGASEAEFEQYAAAAAAAVRERGRQLLSEPQLAAALDRWRLPSGGRVMAVGDSIITYRYSFARLLAAMTDLRRAEERITWRNVAQSGYTSTHGLESTFTQYLAYQPDWVFIMFGVNDCKQFGGGGTRTLVSLAEYQQNMTAIVQAFRQYTSARVFLLTPTPVVESMTNTAPDFQAARMTWSNANLALFALAVSELARAESLPCADLMRRFGPNPDPALYLTDGLHPNAAGHQIIVAEVLKVLGEQSP